MLRKKFVYTVLGGLVLFASGVALGQKQGASKFAKYLRPAGVRTIDLPTLESNIHLIQDLMPMSEKGISVPAVRYDSEEDQMQASVFVSAAFEKMPLDSVKKEVATYGALSYGTLKSSGMTDLREEDFIFKVYRFTSRGTELFAEYRKGDVVLR